MIMRNAALRNLPACPTRTLLIDNSGRSCGKRKRKKAAPSLDMQDAHWLVGIGRVRKSVFGEGADKQPHYLIARVRGTGVEYFCQIAATGICLLPHLPPIEGMVRKLPPHQ